MQCLLMLVLYETYTCKVLYLWHSVLYVHDCINIFCALLVNQAKNYNTQSTPLYFNFWFTNFDPISNILSNMISSSKLLLSSLCNSKSETSSWARIPNHRHKQEVGESWDSSSLDSDVCNIQPGDSALFFTSSWKMTSRIWENIQSNTINTFLVKIEIEGFSVAKEL